MGSSIRRAAAYFVVPLFLLLLGYGTVYIAGKPVIDFVVSSLNIILLSEAPDFTEEITLNNIVREQEVIQRSLGIDQGETANEEQTADNKGPMIKSSELQYPAYGTHYGDIVISRLSIREALFFGDDDAILRYGAGQYSGSCYIGETGTTLIGGHNTGTFANLLNAEIDDEIEITTLYGNYIYRITDLQILKYNDNRVLDALKDQDTSQLILYTCYPLFSMGSSDQRVFVFAQYESGPLIDENA